MDCKNHTHKLYVIKIHSSRDRLRFDLFRRSRDLDRLLSRFDLFLDRLRERESRL